MASNILNWPRGVKISVKVLLMFICCAGLCVVPFLVQKTVLRAFVLSAGATVAADTVANVFFSTMFLWFSAFLVAMLLVNLIFFLIDECKNDTVTWRRTLQVVLNIMIIVGGICTGFFFLMRHFPAQDWWPYVLFSMSFLKKLLWFPYLIFIICTVFQMILDIWLFGPQNRNPWIARILKRAALKSAR